MLDLNDVAVFVRVVRCGSFAAAARQLGIPPNTLSRRVQQLEAHLGTRLLQRSTRKLSLTHAGQDFHNRCAQAVEGLVDAGQALLSQTEAPQGLVRVAAPADFFDFFPMKWLADFLAENPLVRVEFVLSDTRADLIADRVDVAVRGGVLEDSGLFARQVLDAGLDRLVASPDYIALRGVPTSLQDLTNHDCLVFAHPSGRATWSLSEHGGTAAEVQLAGRLSGNTVQVLRKAALAGLGIALLPSPMTLREIRAGLLVPVLTQYHRKGHGVYLVYASRRHLPSAVSAFIELLAAKLGDFEDLPMKTPETPV